MTLSQGAPAPDAESRPTGAHRFSAQAIAELEEIVTHYPEPKAACLPALWIAQREYGGFLTPAAIREVAERLSMTYPEVEGVATFYTMYNLRPRGRHHLEVCTCLSCAVCGGYEVLHKIEHELGITVGETTADGEFTLSECECLDMCGGATVMQVGDRYFTNVTPDNVSDIIAQLRDSDDYTPTKLADAIVKILLPGSSETGGGSSKKEDLAVPAGPMLGEPGH
jgi:NADH-quinone oxidoreductase subunit E